MPPTPGRHPRSAEGTLACLALLLVSLSGCTSAPYGLEHLTLSGANQSDREVTVELYTGLSGARTENPQWIGLFSLPPHTDMAGPGKGEMNFGECVFDPLTIRVRDTTEASYEKSDPIVGQGEWPGKACLNIKVVVSPTFHLSIVECPRGETCPPVKVD